MIEPLTLDQIHQAFTEHFAAVGNRKQELAATVRDCCQELRLGKALVVAGRRVEWLKAYCTVWGGREYKREGYHPQLVLMINGTLVDEPKFEITRPDCAANGWDAIWKGPQDGWYSVAAQQLYELECSEQGDPDVRPDKPAALRVCSATDLLEVAQALPDALAAWHYQQHANMKAQADNLHQSAVLLGQRIAASRVYT